MHYQYIYNVYKWLIMNIKKITRKSKIILGSVLSATIVVGATSTVVLTTILSA